MLLLLMNEFLMYYNYFLNCFAKVHSVIAQIHKLLFSDKLTLHICRELVFFSVWVDIRHDFTIIFIQWIAFVVVWFIAIVSCGLLLLLLLHNRSHSFQYQAHSSWNNRAASIIIIFFNTFICLFNYNNNNLWAWWLSSQIGLTKNKKYLTTLQSLTKRFMQTI